MAPLKCLAPRLPVLALVFACLAVNTPASPAWSSRVWQSDDGLPNNRVTSLAQTPDGYLWVATATRLVRFDGDHFEEVSRESIAPGTMQRMSTVLQSRDGGLWLAMDHGPLIYAKGGATQLFTNNLPDENVQTLTEAADGALWVTYRGGTACRLKEGKVSQFNATNGLPPWTLCSLAADARGDLWFAKGGEFGNFESERFHPEFPVAQSTTIVRVAKARDGGVWICAGTTLLKFESKGPPRKIGIFHPAMAEAQPTVMLEDKHGGVWIGTSDSGLFYFNGEDFENVVTRHREILCLLEDREGSVWVGTGGGLEQIRPRGIAVENAASGLPFDSLRSVCEDAKGTVWAATQNGLLVNWSNGVWNTVSTDTNWPGGLATCVTTDDSGAIWIGTQNFALDCLRDGKFTTYTTTNGLLSHMIHALFAAHNGDVWVGGNAPASVQRLRAGQFQNFTVPHGIGFIRAFAEDTNGTMWIGSMKGALFCIRGDEVINAGAQLGSSNSVRSLFASPDGSVWIGYAGFGLGRVKDGRLATLLSNRGLVDDFISQIISDGNGWMWFGADHGIFKIRESELNQAMDNPDARAQCIRYGRGEGLPSLQANFDEFPNSWQTRDGKLLLPMSSALAVVDPSELHEKFGPPPVLLKRVLVDDATVATYGGAVPAAAGVDLQNPQAALRLPPGHHRVEFDFTALSFNAPENVAIEYRLDNFDDKWVDAGAQRKAIYSQLAAGRYRFQARARISGGVWGEQHAVLPFSLAPFFWQTVWFQLAAILLFTLMVIALVRYVSFRRLRTKVRLLEQQAALDRERARIARDIHDHLGGTLTQMKLQLELALRNGVKAEKIEGHVQKSLSAARQAIQSLDETVWAVNPNNDTLPHLVNYIGEYAVDFLDTAGIRCRLELPDELPPQPVATDTRHHLFLAVKEGLNNVVRHASASEVRLSARVNNGSLQLTLEDNGHGFQQTPGNTFAEGLHNLRERMEEIGGEFRVESEPGGTRLSFTCPWRAGG